MSPKKVLITGHTGFIGTNLVRALAGQPEQRYQLFGLDLTAPRLTDLAGSFGWDQLERLPRDLDAVIHLAGKAHDLKKTASEDEYFAVNCGLTQKIFDWFLGSAASQFFMMSSVKAVADEVAGPLEESHPAQPLTPYGRSKRAAEEYLLSCPLLAPKQLYILRPCMVHGPGNKGNLNLLYRLVKARIPYPLGSFENARSFLSIDNFCFIVQEMLQRAIEPGIYHLADDQSLSTNELVSLIGQALGKQALILRVPPELVRLAARAGDLLGLPLNSERLQKLTESYVVSNRKLVQALGRPLPTSAVDGLLRTIRSFEGGS